MTSLHAPSQRYFQLTLFCLVCVLANAWEDARAQQLGPLPDLKVTARLSSETPVSRVGYYGEFIVAVTNTGTQNASGVVARSYFPPSVQFRWATTTRGACSHSNGWVTCNINTLAPNQGAKILISFVPTDTNTVEVISDASANEPDAEPSNNNSLVAFDVGLPRLYFDDSSASVLETPGGTNLVCRVWMSGPFSQTVTVDYSVTNHTATAWADYVPTNGTIVFPPGSYWQTFNIPVLDDQSYESYESVQINFSRPVNAELGSFLPSYAVIVDNEPTPTLAVSDATIVEGDSGTNEAVFTVSLSAPFPVPVFMWFVTADGTAKAGSDYEETALNFTFEPGVTNQSFAVPVRGDQINESNETFVVNLSTSAGVIMARSQGIGTIVNDDAVPGRFDHFVWASIPSIQATNRPFRVTVTAVDAFGAVVPDYSGDGVSLTAMVTSGPSNLVFAPRNASGFLGGVWSDEVTFSNIGTYVVLRASDGLEHVGVSNPFIVNALWPLWITAPDEVSEGDGAVAGQASVLSLYPVNFDVAVSLTSGDTNALLVPTSVIIPAGQTSAVFTITVVDDALLNGSRTVSIFPVATRYDSVPEYIQIHDNETAVLSVSLPQIVIEGQGTLQGQVTLSAAPSTNVLVPVSSSDTSELIVWSSGFIPAGQTSGVFIVSIPNDTIIDGPQNVVVTAHMQNWTDGVGNVIVQDDESTNIVFTLASQGSLHEGLAPLTNALRVQFGGTLTTNLVINLVSSDPTEAALPASVVLAAGQTSTNFTLTIVDDADNDGARPVTLVASAPGFSTASLSFIVADNDVHHFTFASMPTLQTGSVPFRVQITAQDVNDMTVTPYQGTNFTLSTTSDAGPLFVESKQPNEARFIGGVFSGYIAIPHWNKTNVQVIVRTPGGASGESNPFDLVAPAWTASLRVRRAQIIGADVVIEFETLTGFHYSLEQIADLGSGAWQVLESDLLGNGQVKTVTDINGALSSTRFYRLQVRP